MTCYCGECKDCELSGGLSECNCDCLKTSRADYRDFNKETGNYEPSERHKGGMSVDKIPKALFDPNRNIRKFLAICEAERDLIGLPLGPTVFTALCNDNGLNVPLSTVGVWLSLFNSIGLVEHVRVNYSGGTYILKQGEWQDNLKFVPKKSTDSTELGAHLIKVPKELLDPNSLHCRLLRIMAENKTKLLRPKDIDEIYFKRHGMHGFASRKSVYNSVTIRLGEFFTLGYVNRERVNKRANRYKIMPEIADLVKAGDFNKIFAIGKTNLKRQPGKNGQVA